VQVLATCSISASNLSFSDITTGTTTNNDASSTLTVNCSSGTPYTVALDNGTNYSVGRRMASGASYINYVLYSDSTRSTQWNSTNTKTGTGSGSDQNLTVYGRIPSSQSVTNTGSYGDTVIATVSY
jgi:spore coat protein U-like protein